MHRQNSDARLYRQFRDARAVPRPRIRMNSNTRSLVIVRTWRTCEHGQHTVDRNFFDDHLGLHPASPDDRLQRGSVNAPTLRPIGDFRDRNPSIAASIDASRPRRASSRPARAPTECSEPAQPSVCASLGGGTQRLARTFARVDADQIAHEFHLFLRGLLFAAGTSDKLTA